MHWEEITVRQRIWNIVKMVWTLSIITGSVVLGASIGWDSHGIIGAVALGFVGLVVGVFLSSPALFLQLMP